MLRVSKLTDYGTVAMAYMARQPEQVHTAAEVAAAVRVAVPTVSKLLKMLAKGGLLLSQRGAKGGYSLSRHPERISVADVIVAIEGPIAFTECSGGSGLCVQERGCSIRANWQFINQVVRDALDKVTLLQMIQPAPSQPVKISMPAPRSAASTTGA